MALPSPKRRIDIASKGRPQLVRLPEENRRICMLIGEELLRWPGVEVHPMFGLQAFYRRTLVFAMIPDKSALGNPRAIAYKLKIGAGKSISENWQLFEIASEVEISLALGYLRKAYQNAFQIDGKAPGK